PLHYHHAVTRILAFANDVITNIIPGLDNEKQLDNEKEGGYIEPSHYGPKGKEPIDIIEANDIGFHLGNAIKYLVRAGKKSGENWKKDLEKAIWYIQRYTKWKDNN